MQRVPDGHALDIKASCCQVGHTHQHFGYLELVSQAHEEAARRGWTNVRAQCFLNLAARFLVDVAARVPATEFEGLYGPAVTQKTTTQQGRRSRMLSVTSVSRLHKHARLVAARDEKGGEWDGARKVARRWGREVPWLSS